MKMTGLVELNAVVAVANRRSFRGAASDLGMSASALSHAISALEHRIGVRLFNRTTRSVSLSEAGEQFIARVRPALHEISGAMEAANRFRDTPKGTLRINTSEGAARMFLKTALEFLRRYPEMTLDLVAEGRLVDIVAEGFDAGVRLAEAVPKDMIAVPCSPDLRWAVVGSPEYFEGRTYPSVPEDLLSHHCIRRRLPSGALQRWEFRQLGQEIAIEVVGSITLNDHNLMLEAALGGAGLAYVNEWFARSAIASRRLIRVLEDWMPSIPGLSLYYPGHRHVPAGMKALVGIIHESRYVRA